MATPYVGEIRMFAGNFPPLGWEFCNGQQLPISENETLFQLIGTTYGGDGQSTFNLPNLQSRIPIHMGTNPANGSTFQIGEMAGVESVTLTTQQIPVHNHAAMGAAVTGDQTSLNNALPANSVTITPYLNSSPDAAFNAQAIGPTGGSQPHDNTQPFVCIYYIISLFGLFPNPT
jgi:microcystin-dependent protein